MKILIAINSGDTAQGGGSSVAVRNMIESLLALKDVQLHVVYKSGTEGTLIKWLAQHDVPFTSIAGVENRAWPRIKGLKSLLQWPLNVIMGIVKESVAVSRTRDIIKRIKPDIVHVNNGTLLYGVKSAEKEGIPCLWHLREYADSDFDLDLFPNRGYIIRKMKRHFTVAISPYISQHFSLNNPQRNFVVLDGVMHADETIYIEEKQDYFLFVGGVTKSKGCLDLIKAFATYSKNNPKGELWLAGRVTEQFQNELTAILEEAGAVQRVKFLGFRSDRYELMRYACACIVPSLNEGLGFITVEAMMNGSIVIGRDTGGTKLVMDETGDCALRFMTVDELADCMEKVINQAPIVFKERILKAQQLASKKFCIERYGRDVYEIYKEMVLK